MNQLKNDINNQKWFAVYTKVRHEKAVYNKLQENNVECFLPLREKLSNWKDRKKKVLFPLFPGYLFVRISPEQRIDILKVPGVIRILGVNGNLTPVPEYQIEGIKELLKSGLDYEILNLYTKGKKVEVINGPLIGAVGKIIHTSGHYKLILSVDIINSSVMVEVDFDHVELL